MRRIAFIDRDGTIIEEPADQQIDAYEKLRFVAGAIPALLRLQAAGYELVMVSNQDGLGSPRFPRESFEGPHRLMMQVLESQGVVFREVLIDPSLPEENSPNRKPGVGMVLHYLRDRSIDLAHSVVIGDRETDLRFADNLGARGFRIGPGHDDWDGIVRRILASPRRAEVERTTRETKIRVRVDLDRTAEPVAATGLGFFDHMLEQLGKHGGFALAVSCAGDLHIDEHHTVEDTALALGQALRQALGDKRGIARYGFTLPMDEALATAALDFSGRSYFVFEGAFPRERVGELPTELVPHFFRSLCEAAGLNLHLSVRGENTHHMIEACFKAVARALRQAVRKEGAELPSTKGAL
ncbi:bifunctional histidinol-phosphatase/imidazoleglycerol-phosphate dehydratase HisB [Rehaibacterium terrae]|jgi:imidazoleglycerol-phosphate dehydratase/histidinol-phosphatase|uniref:Histidine biosynthesis bifunctional protein HisB n=1 Tax=Rehaibacterium terrae TaxID=1341696 RepID=A0A7W7V6Q8_9GAMM|nr:bifunctional histidinol-phosphatase/imidazoleglycerol-phosphate dehydratase HisB [Rehaibacterium terrae]MBB5014275.1 imidazoleglycerol-phosphate dehydratase/histidinol-phosphatase [Rehaibacterium terrae]